MMFTSLSKRSNVPGMRSGFVAGDARLLKTFLLYRTYHGSAVSGMVQAASVAAWSDETHVEENRTLYRRKFATVTPMLSGVLDVRLPDAAFYLWAGVPGGDDEVFARDLLARYNVTVLPGSYLARSVNGVNPAQAAFEWRSLQKPKSASKLQKELSISLKEKPDDRSITNHHR